MRYLLVKTNEYVLNECWDFDKLGSELSVAIDDGNMEFSQMIEGNEYDVDDEIIVVEDLNIDNYEQPGYQFTTYSIKEITEEEYNRYNQIINDYFNLFLSFK